MLNTGLNTGNLNQKNNVDVNSNKTGKKCFPPGELYFTILLVVLIIVFGVQTIPLQGIFNGSTTGPGALPQLIFISLIVSTTIIIVQQFVKNRGNNNFKETLAYLLPKENIIMLCLIVLYAVGIYFIGYKISTFVFIWAVSYILNREVFIKKGLVALVFTSIISLVFEKGFLIILP